MRTEIYIGLLVLGFFTAGCQDWLNVQPKTSVQEEDIFSTEFGFKDVLTGFYIDMGSQDLYGKNLTYGFADFLAKRYDNTVVASELYNYQGEYKNRMLSGRKGIILLRILIICCILQRLTVEF